MANALPPYVWPGGPMPTVTPFTYRDGLSYLQRFERLIKYLNRVIIPYIDQNVAGLAETFTTEVNRLIDEVNQALVTQNEEVDEKLVELTQYVDAAVAQIIDDSIEVQDPVVAGIVNDDESATRIVLDGLYQAINTVSDEAVEALIDDIESVTRLKLDTLYQVKGTVDDDAVEALLADEESKSRKVLDGLYAPYGEENIATLADGVTEWWCHPVATTLADPYERTVFGTISAGGMVQACEFNHSTKETYKVDLGLVAVDDHNAPAIWIESGRRPVAAWTDHNRDNIIRIKVGGKNGDIESFNANAVVNFNLGGAASYTQIHKIKHKSSDIVDTLWIFTRKGNDEWGYIEVVVEQSTGTVLVRNFRSVVSAPGRQCYISTADAHRPNGFNQVIRFAWGYNPAQAVHDIYYMEIDVVAEKIGSPVQPTWTHNLGTTIVDNTITLAPLVPHNGTGNSRRFFYTRPGPDSPAVAYADWSESSPENATYHVREFASGGLFTPNSGYVETSADNIAAFGRGFECEIVFKLPSTISGNMGLMGMWNISGTAHTFFLRLTPAGDVEFAVYDPSGTGYAYHTSTAPLAGDMVPGATLGIRVHIDLEARHVARYVSRDAGKSWTMIGTGSAITSGDDALVSSGIRISGRSPLRIPYAATAGEGGKVDVQSFSLRNRIRTAELAGASFISGDWLGGVDKHGLVYTNSGSPTFGSPTWDTDAFGSAGPKVGYTDSANYIAGMAFENPSTMRKVVTVHSVGGSEVVKLWRDNIGVYDSRDIISGNTADGRIIRPTLPVNGKSDRVGINVITQYGSTYQDYEGDWLMINISGDDTVSPQTGTSIVDNGDGTVTISNVDFVDNGDGTIEID